ncbi:MAG: tRNA preQ1(34) S-adenosylmethionine ribosyltransferase-isomerase QueA [Candidatus Margulisbacteria bacterium]|nr:tRNA preQ1(34) S-adenosylmethionine ribosyltransferase-isomerase QueA [Candidatus Margulisiibacteriota bacterium]
MIESKLSDFDFFVPDELIAQSPIENRDESRLLHYNRSSTSIKHHKFKEFCSIIPPNSVLVFNNTKVIKARVLATKSTGATIECFFLHPLSATTWTVMLKNGRKVSEGDSLVVHDHQIKIHSKNGKYATAEIIGIKQGIDFLDAFGQTPLPPYIKSDNPNSHESRYQTIFASVPGAVAAPTASLHFTDDVFAQLKSKNIDIIFITLHVGLGTFNPIKTCNILDHAMHYETYIITPDAAKQLNEANAHGKPIIAVGTTVARCLESNIKNNVFYAETASTNLYITPGHTFKSIHGLLTNFHLPKSSLFILISALIGRETAINCYQTAIDHRYRFFSYGDAMLIA